MTTFDQADDFLRRALREDRAASRATSVEARLSHQKLATRLREAIAQIARLRGADR